MLTIKRGRADDQGTDFWAIYEQGGQRHEFVHSHFDNIQTGAGVYFIDFNLDGLCENVQPQVDVDDLVDRARPPKGITAEAEAGLRSYLMTALLAMRTRPRDDWPAYYEALKQKMQAVRDEAVAGASAVTVQLLQAIGIMAQH